MSALISCIRIQSPILLFGNLLLIWPAYWVPSKETYYDKYSKFPNEMLTDIAKNFHPATSDNRRFKDEALENVASGNGQSNDEPTISIHAWCRQEMVGSNYYVWCAGQGMLKFTTEWSQANFPIRT